MEFTLQENCFTKRVSLERSKLQNIKPLPPACLLCLKFRRFHTLFSLYVFQLCGLYKLNCFSSKQQPFFDFMWNQVSCRFNACFVVLSTASALQFCFAFFLVMNFLLLQSGYFCFIRLFCTFLMTLGRFGGPCLGP